MNNLISFIPCVVSVAVISTLGLANAASPVSAPNIMMVLPDAAKATANAPIKLNNARAVLEADGHTLHGLPWANQESTQSLSSIYGIDFIPAPLVAMANQDNEFYLVQDEMIAQANLGNGPKPLRFAVPFDVNLSIADGQWIPVAGGSIWRVVVESSNATTARLHLTGINLPSGQELRLSAPGMDGSVIGPIEGLGEFGTGEAWSFALPTAKVMVEWFVPTGFVAKQLPFAGVEYYHGYRDIYQIDGGGPEGGIAGNCHNQPSCYSTWLNESNGTIRLIFSGFLCSGQLTATTAADETPYVSTANHCISTQTVANSCQFNFFYRANACGGSTSAGVNVTGSDLVSTYPASDSTLLMIRPTLPTTVGWVGWTNANPATNTASTCLHHPGGAAQAISFGVKNAGSFPCGSPSSNWNSISWSNGITEGGSSGSAIYRTSDRKLYGTLSCGGSSCANPAADDGYGRWDLAVNSGGFAALLAVGSDDAQEQNDTCATAKVIAANTTYTNMVVKRLDEDWYSIALPIGSQLSMNMTYTHANGDVDLELYSNCSAPPVLQRLLNVNDDIFIYTNNTASSTILMRVFLGSDTRNNYTFSYTQTIAPPANDECAAATVVGPGSVAFNTSNATNSAQSIPASCTDGAGAVMNKDVWFKFAPACSGTATVSTCATASFDTRIVVYSGAACPGSTTAVFACNDDGVGCGTTSKVNFSAIAGQSYYVRLGSKLNVGGSGTVAFSCALCVGDMNGTNDIDGSDLAILLGGWGSCPSCIADINHDNFVDGADLALMLGAWGLCP